MVGTDTIDTSKVDDLTKGTAGDGTKDLAKTGDAAKNDLTGGRSNTQRPTVTDEKGEEKPSSLKINIKLDIDVEVHLTARVKGDITIGLL